jgi:hypothetical protein
MRAIGLEKSDRLRAKPDLRSAAKRRGSRFVSVDFNFGLPACTCGVIRTSVDSRADNDS